MFAYYQKDIKTINVSTEIMKGANMSKNKQLYTLMFWWISLSIKNGWHNKNWKVVLPLQILLQGYQWGVAEP